LDYNAACYFKKTISQLSNIDEFDLFYSSFSDSIKNQSLFLEYTIQIYVFIFHRQK